MITKSTSMKSLMVAGGLLAAAAASAEDFELSANVALSSDYRFRYISQTMEEPAISGGFDAALPHGFYVGTWASNVDFGDDATIEVDFYGGWATEFENGIGIDLGIIDYEYFDDDANPNILEVYGGVSWEFISATLYYGVDNELGEGGDTDSYIWVEGGVEYPVGPVTLAGTVGRFESDDFDDEYFGWSLGASTDFVGVTWDVTYYDTDSDGEDLFGDNADGKVVFSVSKEL